MHEAMFFCNLQCNLLDNIALQVVVNMLHAAPTCFDNVARSRGLQSQSGLVKHFLPRHPQRGAEGRGGEGRAKQYTNILIFGQVLQNVIAMNVVYISCNSPRIFRCQKSY